MNAWEDLQEVLEPGECVESIVFGSFGWSSFDDEEPGYGEEKIFVPKEKRGIILTPDEAKPIMDGWSFNGGYGAPSCYACYIWTNKRVLWVTQYDGSTSLDSAPRNPKECKPQMPGG